MDEDNESRKAVRRIKDADDIKTTEGVLDNKTREILRKLGDQGLLREVQGVVSLGKEAGIYLAKASAGIYSKMCRTRQLGVAEGEVPVAIKIYKTSAMVFKDRAKYLEGERRFKKFARRNSRKLIELWAEKEVRNLHRLQKAGIPSPRPLFLRRNVLIMTMIGEMPEAAADRWEYGRGECLGSHSSSGSSDSEEDGWSAGSEPDIDADTDGENYEWQVTPGPSDDASSDCCSANHTDSDTEIEMKRISTSFSGIAPNLKSAALSLAELEDAYAQVVELLMKLYRDCGLVHADLSEYNLLYWNRTVYVIDVGQSVEFDHPSASEFLQLDIANINAFFARQGVAVCPAAELFREVTSQSPAPPSAEALAQRLERRVLQSAQALSETPEEKKTRKKAVKEKNRERRQAKLSKKEKSKLGKKIQIAKKR